jgi:hypothetical protein
VLDDSDQRIVAVGSSMNPDTSAGIFNLTRIYALLDLPNGTSCTINSPPQDQFAACGQTGLRYNAARRIFLYTLPDNIGAFNSNAYYARLLAWVRAPFTSMIQVFKGTTLTDRESALYPLNKLPDFNRLYISHTDTTEGLVKTIYGLTDTINLTERMLINYTGFDTDFCSELHGAISDPSAANCTRIGNSHYLFAKRTFSSPNTFLDNWIVLTAKLRVSPEPYYAPPPR